MIRIFANLRRFDAPDRIAHFVEQWDALGIDGVVSGDHIFRPNAPRTSVAEAHRGMDQLTILTVVATLSRRLRVGTLVSNVGFQHPVLLIRRFAQLAVLFGGDRVLAGFGAGWARREFDALGLQMPPHEERIARLEESLRIARALYDEGFVDYEGRYVTARALPLTPKPDVSPRILVAGGSPRLIALAARYADHWDVNVPPHRITKIEPQGRLMTTTNDLEDSVRLLASEARAAGRSQESVTRSVVIDALSICAEAEIAGETERICGDVGLPAQSLDECPYALLGEPSRIAAKIDELRSRLGLSWIAIPYTQADQFCTRVAPLLMP
ncbi:MAG TPA: LLM class flavin-dependent oxidoreductase [Gaiellaceae bacterium]|nr:LLM class flavin-dependent oxidoreductase [Gaiellaceae bacterium]